MKHVTIVIVTYNRASFLEKCLSSLHANTVYPDYNVLVWNNHSNDRTKAIISRFEKLDSRFKGIHHHKNVYQGGYGMALLDYPIKDYVLEVDDDVINFPYGWLTRMVYACEKVPYLGYLAANVIQNDETNGAKPDQQYYIEHDYGDGVILEFGPTGGWCTITPGHLYKEVGGFNAEERDSFFLEDADYRKKIARKGYLYGILKRVTVYHASGLAGNATFKQGKKQREKKVDKWAAFLENPSKSWSPQDIVEILLDVLEKYRTFLRLYGDTAEYISGLIKNGLKIEVLLFFKGIIANGIDFSRRLVALINILTRLQIISRRDLAMLSQTGSSFVDLLDKLAQLLTQADFEGIQKVMNEEFHPTILQVSELYEKIRACLKEQKKTVTV